MVLYYEIYKEIDWYFRPRLFAALNAEQHSAPGRPTKSRAPIRIMSAETARKELTARLDPSLYEELREATYKLRISKQQAIIEALKMWLGSSSAISARQSYPERRIPADMVPVVEWLAHLWTHTGTPEQEGLKSTLKALAGRLRTEHRVRTKSAL